MAIDSRPGLVYSIAGPFLWKMRRPGHSRRCVLLKELLTLFLTFAKVGVMTFGGGYAMLPILQREVVENKGWATDEELTDYFAIGQCTPGVIAVNTATFIGQKRAGIDGGIVATLGVVFPSLLIIVVVTMDFMNQVQAYAMSHQYEGLLKKANFKGSGLTAK